MVKYFSNFVFAALILFPLTASAQLPNRDSVLVDSMKLLRPIHFSHDTGSEVRAVRRTYLRLYREQYQREENRRLLLRNAPFLILDSIWQHNYAEQEALIEKLLSTIADTTTDYRLRIRLIRLLSSTGHPKALRFLMRNIAWMEFTEDGGEIPLCFPLAQEQANLWALLTPMMTSICEDPHDEDLDFMLFGQLLYFFVGYDDTEASDGEYYSNSIQTLVLIFLKKTQQPDGSPNPRLMRFYEYLKRE